MKRKLTPDEIHILKSIYFDEVEYDNIIITDQHFFSYMLKKYSAVVFDNTIVFSKKKYKNDFSKSIVDITLLIHEVCHVWQFQNLNYRWYKAAYEHIMFIESPYQYKISDKKKLTDYKYEQQGEIMADFFRHIQNKSPLVKTYEKVIYKVIKKPK
jgi:predicted P-loop ATPase/GTPase